jgi:hypothetical protein
MPLVIVLLASPLEAENTNGEAKNRKIQKQERGWGRKSRLAACYISLSSRSAGSACERLNEQTKKPTV